MLEPLDFMARLAALVPCPRLNLTRFHGVFAPNARHRHQIVPRRARAGWTSTGPWLHCGGTGDDWIYNGAKVESKAEAYADTVSVTATISGTKTGVAGGAALSDSSAQTIATARGIEGGAGHDRIWNTGDIDSKAISGEDTTSVTAGINGSLSGVAGGAVLSDASAGAVADAAGISGGDGNDEVVNAAKVSASANANVDTTAVTVTLSVSKEGVSGGAALSDTSSAAWSAARGIDGGAGNDRIWNEGSIEAASNASADTTSVVVQVAGSLYGAAGGDAMSDSSAAALAQSTGIQGGAGDDVIVNASKVTTPYVLVRGL